MFESDQDQRTLPASPRRRAEARRSGFVPRSPDVPATLVLIVFTFGLILVGPSLLAAGREVISASLAQPPTGSTVPVEVEWSLAARTFCGIAVVWLLAAVLAAVAGNVLQFGLLFTPQLIRPDPERISPGRGLKRMGSDCHPRALLLTVARLVTIAAVVGWFVWSIWPVPASSDPSTDAIAAELADAMIALGCALAGGAVVISLLTALVERIRYETRLRMTVQEAREERRLNEADPAVAQRRRTSQLPMVTAMTEPTVTDPLH